MTPQQRRTYSLNYIRTQSAIENKYVKPVYWALKRKVSEWADKIIVHGPQVARNHITTSLFNEHLTPILMRLYKDAGLVRASQVRSELRQMNTKRASFGSNDELVNAVIDYLIKFLLEKSVKTISQTTRDWILREIDKGIRDGKGSADIAKEIEGAEFLKFQALRIVRTETVRATNAGGLEAMKASPFEVEKEWISAHDNRVRHSHRTLDGQRREVGEEFKPGLMFPGDPNADASETVNCRCTTAAIPKRDEQGRLIRKPIRVTATTSRQFLQTG